MEPEIGGIAYDADAQLYPGLSMPPGSTELLSMKVRKKIRSQPAKAKPI